MNFLVKLAIFVGFYAVFHAFILRRFIAGCVCRSRATLEGKTVIITGSNTGIGKETALDLAQRNARVIMACRDLTKAEAALKEIVEKTGNKNIVAKHLNLASLKSVREFAEDINSNEPRLDVLMNNAGVMFVQTLSKTEDGFEMQMGVNHLGHFLLTNLLLDLLKRSAPSRIINVSSMFHRFVGASGFDFDNMNGEVSYSPYGAYGQSKLANILFTRELARRLNNTQVTANSLHPGAVATELTRYLPNWMQMFLNPIYGYFTKNPREGAQTSIHLAVSEELDDVTGQYFADCDQRMPAEAAQDDQAAGKLWDVSAKLVGLDTSD
ncbi:retinol dehydrogenase 13-like [Dendronephthya gigantea]|uniref:retinol dehydrogenase 13-like n=1 Tax=Dendronephthya gigantea TaxID=151771 RepID=UPI001069825C|nr:retinol dehydrogenase 13-like [Dendronephthya gigantea]